MSGGKVCIDIITLKAVQSAGRYLSNVAYNLKQQESIKKEWRVSMEAGQKAWDEAIVCLISEIEKQEVAP